MASPSTIAAWDVEADVVVLGSGVAGIVAALEARETDPGAEVVILEKLDERRSGGNSRASGQSLSFPTDSERCITYQRALNLPSAIPEPLLAAWAQARASQRPWVEEMAAAVGFELFMWTDRGSEFPDLPGSDCIEALYSLRPISSDRTGAAGAAAIEPAGVWRCFRAHLDRHPEIEVMYETPAVDLVQDPDTREVFGVLAHRAGETIAVRADRGVIMCVGGYEANPEMIRDYAGYDWVAPYGSPGDTGDGIRMLQRAGADLWHLRNRTETGGIHPGIPAPGCTSPFLRNPHMNATSWLDIAADDRRFYAEAQDFEENHFKQRTNGHWEDIPTARVQPVHMLFDERTRTGSCLVARGLAWAPVVDGYRWSDDNGAELDQGWITPADSVRDLAAKLGRDPDAVAATVERYNAAARAGHDPDFGRSAGRMTPLQGPPFYAVAVVPGLVCTTGGARHDERGGVVDHEGSPIPRLYEAGELGSMHANLYQNGSFLTEAMITGRWAGASAARERAWTEAAAQRA